MNTMRRTLGLRLSVWYGAVFILSTVALVGITYALLSSSLAQRDHDIIRATLREYVCCLRSRVRIAAAANSSAAASAIGPPIGSHTVTGPSDAAPSSSSPSSHAATVRSGAPATTS